MKRLLYSLAALTVSGFMIAGCTPKSQLEKTLVDNPEILFNVIKAHPKAFLDTVNEAVEIAKSQMAESQMEEEFKNRKEPVIEEGRVIFGNKDAPITIVEYSDFQCPYCRDGFGYMETIMEKYGDKVRVVYKHLPLDNHPQALIAAQYFEAVGQQDPAKAKQYHDLVFEGQEELNEKTEKFLESVVKKVGADLGKAKAALKSKAVNDRIEADMAEAQKFGFSGTPGFLVNGVSVRGAYPPEHFSMIIDRLLKDAK